jgi:hypothetical protein
MGSLKKMFLENIFFWGVGLRIFFFFFFFFQKKWDLFFWTRAAMETLKKMFLANLFFWGVGLRNVFFFFFLWLDRDLEGRRPTSGS